MRQILLDVQIDAAALDRLQTQFDVSIRKVEPEERTREVSRDLLGGVDYLFCTYPPANFADLLPSLQWIQIASAGYTQLLPLRLPEHGIRASNARGCFDVPIAEWNIAMMVNLARDLRQMVRHQETGTWDRSARFQREIRGLTVGLWGYGGIGRETARLAKAMGLRVHVLSREGIGPVSHIYAVAGTGDPQGQLPDRVFLRGEETEFLASLDFLILAMPLTPATEGIVGERELQILPRTAFVLNPSRGPLIQEQALLRALDEGWIAGAALDTHYQYPLPSEHPLWRYPNVILTPHISGSSLSPHFRKRVWEIFLENCSRLEQGMPLMNELSRTQLVGA